MRENEYTDDVMILAARLYYIDNLPQAQIAKLVSVSQSKVSRMLSLARERGLVRVSVPEYESRDSSVEQLLGDRLGVRAVVVRTPQGLPGADLRQSFGYFAAPVVSEWIERKNTVAVSGGRAMQALVQHMKPALTAAPEVTFVQAMGNIDSSSGPYDALELGRTLASRWGGTFLTLNTPAILPDKETCRQFLALGQIRDVMERLAQADIAMVGIGTLENSVFIERKVLRPAQIEALRRAGAVGEILGRFYNGAGEECATDFAERVVSLRLDQLRRIPNVVAVVTGADRGEAVVAAVRAGLIKTLVMDESAACAVRDKSR